jgi:hypothetical protein
MVENPTPYADSIEIITRPEVELDAGLLESLKTLHQEENQVIVHVHLKIRIPPMRIRIWPNTLLIPHEGGPSAKMIQCIGISKAPQWMHIFERSCVFTLIFEGLTKDCLVFDLVEDIPSPNRFQYMGIVRNQTDVYHLSMSD